MRAIIIDDEMMAIEVLRMMLEQFKPFPVVIEGAFTNVEDAFYFLENKRVDVVFLDMEMISMHGLRVAEHIKSHYPTSQIIFVTAHSHFAVEAFEVEATDYLLKPVTPKRLQKALEKAQHKLSTQQPVEKEHYLIAHTMGTFYLMNNENEMVKWRTKKTRELFLYLWVHQHKPILNIAISEVLWPEMGHEKALTNLHTAIYYLRQLFKANGIDNAIQLVNNHYMLAINVRSDFEELIKLLDEQHKEQHIERIVALYEGDFLQEEDFQWVIPMQQQLKEKVLATFEAFVETPHCTAALKQTLYKKMLDLDVYNERYMLQLMTLLFEQNRRSECVQLYNVIKERLELELCIPIPPYIQHMYDRVMQQII
ncbi:response regulator [Caryophanon latum]|uniref:Response regulatory domain-containing protein n=1 Tax=Caryophanon latum TaxID=33977 RepID=A0A1C0YIJ2_9BACL|nr:response regulator [Caryophanon latum]OCS86988.1 hypothetical protein A6K76_14160 [Caryophanon latum]